MNERAMKKLKKCITEHNINTANAEASRKEEECMELIFSREIIYNSQVGSSIVRFHL